MPSLRVMSALAVVALTARPASSFLGPIATPAGPRRSGAVAARSTTTANSAFRSRQPRPSRGSSNPSQRDTAAAARNARTALGMGKKKGVGKKKAAAAAAKKKAQASAGGVGGVKESASSAATAVAEHDDVSSGGVAITNRADGEEPVSLPTGQQTATSTAGAPPPVPIMEAAVNGAPKEPVPAAAAATAAGGGGGAGGGAKGFGAAAPPQPRPLQKGLNRKQGTEPQGQGGQGQARPPKASPPGVKGNAGFDALATGVPVAGNTDHERVSVEADCY